MNNPNVGFAICGSFCTIEKAVEEIKTLKNKGYNVIPIMSDIVYNTDNRFNSAEELRQRVEDYSENKIIHTVVGAEPIGPKKLLDVLVVAPCTGNTLAKMAAGVTDTSVTMAVKAHLRNSRPIVLAIATNDALSVSAANIGKLMNNKNIFFVPFGQDEPFKKPTSLIADFSKIDVTVKNALEKKQIQPVLITKSHSE